MNEVYERAFKGLSIEETRELQEHAEKARMGSILYDIQYTEDQRILKIVRQDNPYGSEYRRRMEKNFQIQNRSRLKKLEEDFHTGPIGEKWKKIRLNMSYEDSMTWLEFRG